MVTARTHPERAEPRSIGTSGSANILAREVRLLGAILGEIIVEQAGREVYELVEATRLRAIATRREGAGARVELDVVALDPATLEAVVRAFGLYFQLVNLAEARDRVRRAARRARATGGASEAARIRAALQHASDPSVLGRIAVSPVLTAHPTEARRRTVLVALRRIASLLARADDPRLTPADDRELRRRLREEIAVLWRTAELRVGVPTPLDEVRTAMVVFDETIYRLAPRLYRLADAALAGVEKRRAREADPPRVPAFLRFGSWIGSDRDGHPGVTAEVTEAALAIQADHVLRGHEAVATRLAQVIAAKIRPPGVPGRLAARLARDAADLAELDGVVRERFPDEPFRQRFTFIAERLRRTRLAALRTEDPAGGDPDFRGRYADAAELLHELGEAQDSLVEVGLARTAWGAVQDFRWQVETFGFHLAGLEVRQHASVHAAAIGRSQARGDGPDREEVLATFRSMARLQARFGRDGIARYVISFTSGPGDVLDVLELARQADAGPGPDLEVVPLFESGAALESAPATLEALFADPGYREHVRRHGDRQEVMLGYSDTNKELGYVGANWLLYRAQIGIVDVARRHGVELTIFHGRGGAIGRGGGHLELAVRAQPPGSIDGRLKLTEQGEVIWTRYGDPDLALDHLEVLVAAAVESLASGRADPAASTEGGAVLDELAATAREAYRGVVYDDSGFAGFFARVTPIDQIAALRLGSRPARRSSGTKATVEDLRAIPWVFAWSQARVELPGWYGLGSAVDAFGRRHRETGLRRLEELYGESPFWRTLVDNARQALDRSDLAIARRYAALATEPGDAGRWAAIEREHVLTREALAALPTTTSASTSPRAARTPEERSAALRAPYVDTLSAAQLALLRLLRERSSADPDHPSLPVIRGLIALTISGLSAALQGTG